MTARLARAALDGDEAVFQDLYERVAPALFAWARFRILPALRRRIDEQDVVQEVWLRAVELLRRDAPDPASFRPWIFNVAKYVLLEALRRQRAAGRVDARPGGEASPSELERFPDSVTSLSERLGKDEALGRFVDWIDGLTPEERELVVLCGLEGMSVSDAARRLGRDREVLYKRWQKLRERMRERGVGRELVAEFD